MQKRKTVTFANRTVGDGNPVFVTFEAGPTHHGVDSAKRLIDLAADAGADAIKFQVVDPERLVADREMPFAYEILVDKETGEMEKVSEPLYDILKRRALDADEWRAVKAHADSRSLAFFATVAYSDEVELMAELGCDSIKIASADVNHFPLLREVARTGMSIQLDTGSSTLGEVERAVEIILSEGNENIIIHHCPSGYPARLEGINLNIISTLRAMVPFPIAFSDHSPGSTMDIAAVALGASLVEKTITEDRTTRSIEHIFSLEPPDMAAFVGLMRDLPVALGNHRRRLAPEELTRRSQIRRSVHLAEPAPEGTLLKDCKVIYRRPGHGIGPDQFEALGDHKLIRDLPADHILSFADLD